MRAARASVVIVLGPARPSLGAGVERFLGFVLTAGGNYPDTLLERVDADPARHSVLVRVSGPRVELDRLAYALKTTFRLADVDIAEV